MRTKRGMKRIALKQVNVQDKYGNTPLHMQLHPQRGTSVPLSLGADKKVRNKDAKSAAEVATDSFENGTYADVRGRGCRHR